MTDITTQLLEGFEPSPTDPSAAGTAAGGRGVAWYVGRRLLQAVVVLFIVVTAVFGLSHLAANPVDILLPPGATAQQRAIETRLLGLDKPIYDQYVIFLRHVVTGHFGDSTQFHVPILSLVLTRSLATLRLAVAAIVLAVVAGVPLGIAMAVRSGSKFDHLAGVIVGLAQGIASFWLAVILVFLIGVDLALVPVSGDQGFSSLILPAVSLALAPAVSFTRLTRSAMIDALTSDYVKAARSRGVTPWTVVVRHALRNSVIPVLTYGGVLLGQLLSGAVITETIFAWPGIGQLSILSIQNGDYGVVEVITMLTAAAVIVLNLLVDLSYLFLDPRVRDSAADCTMGGRRDRFDLHRAGDHRLLLSQCGVCRPAAERLPPLVLAVRRVAQPPAGDRQPGA
jgi:peptide/nickel transport system permease protein